MLHSINRSLQLQLNSQRYNKANEVELEYNTIGQTVKQSSGLGLLFPVSMNRTNIKSLYAMQLN